MMKTSRPNHIDYAKVIGMYIVVFYHYAYYANVPREASFLWDVMAIITTFFMPYFYIISGALHRPVSLSVALTKGWTQLLKPYLLINMIVLPIYTIATGVSLESIGRQLLGIISGVDLPNATGNWATAMWFCFSLCVVKVLHSLLYSYLKWVGIAVGCAAGIAIFYVGNVLPLLLDTSLVGFVFFSIGHLLSKPLMSIKDRSSIYRAWIVLGALILWAVVLYLDKVDAEHMLNIRLIQFGPYPLLYLVSGLAGTVFFMVAATFIPSQFAKGVCLTLSNGLIIVLGFHGTVCHLLFSWWLSQNNVIAAAVVAAASLALCYPLILLASKYWPALMGNRRVA